ncbi:MAG TPA: hypothetical protein VN668_16200 [Stellaceae bacterium]|nr:hypothetical protein [Stellaceae bacterium]
MSRSIAPIAGRLAKLLALLASDQPGEVLATLAALRRALDGAGLDFNDLAEAIGRLASSEPAGWNELVEACLSHAEMLSERDRAFLNGVRPRVLFGGEPSEAQKKWLRDIWKRVLPSVEEAA